MPESVSIKRVRQSRNFESIPTESKKSMPIVGSELETESFFLSPYWSLSWSFPYNPDPLCSSNNYSIYDEMREDDQVKSALAIKKDMVINTGWVIKTEDNTNPKSQEAIDFITDNFERLGEDNDIGQTFEESLHDVLTHFDYGFSLTEPVLEIKDGKYRYKSLRTRAPHSFQFHVDAKGNLEKIVQMSNSRPINLDPKIFIHHIYQMNFGNPYGKSDLKSAYIAWKSKKYFIRFFNMYVEKYATPLALLKYKKSYTDSDIDKLNDIITQIKTATGVSVPEDIMIEFVQSQRDASDAYLKGIDYFNMMIARSILMPDLLGLGGTETKGGSYALGREQFKLFLGILKKERDLLARKITTRLVRPLTKYNFGDFPIWFEFNPWTLEDIKEYLRLWIDAVNGKIYEPSDEEINYFRSSIGFPEGEIKRVSPPPPSVFPGFKPTEQNNNFPKKDDDEQENMHGYARREYTKYERKVNFIQIEKDMDEGEERIIGKLSRNAKSIYSDLIAQVRDKGLLKKFNPEKWDTIKPKYLKDMNILFKNYFVDTFERSYENAREEIFPNSKKKYAIELLPDEYLELIKNEAFKMVGDYSVNITKRVKNIVLHGIKDGYSAGEIINIIRDELTSETDRWMETAVRTKSTEIYNEARKQYYENDPMAKEVVVAYQWSAILDDRTSEICRYLDGKIYDIGEISNKIKPPAHFNCRSVLIPITKFEPYKDDPNYKKSLNVDDLVDKGGNLLKPGG